MTVVDPAANLFGTGAISGALRQLINVLTDEVVLRIGGLPDVPVGDVLEVSAGSARDAADAVEILADAMQGRVDADPQAAREQRPLLAAVPVRGADGGRTVHLRVDARAPSANWRVRGRESAMVAVYVDGRYLSTIVVMGERGEPYEVNLGVLAKGQHRVELRAATDVAPVVATIRTTSARIVDGEQALVDRLQPIVAMRDTDHGKGASCARSDAPLLMSAAIEHHADGSRTIEYRVTFSNEDGGTSTPDLLARYGRTVDVEPIYRVTVDATGQVVDETYQTPVHRWAAFDGERIGGRPLLRVSTANNLVSARMGLRPTERWSDSVATLVAPDATDHELLDAHPWVWTIMAKELLREGHVAAADAVRGARQIADPRCYVYVGALDDAARAAIAVAGGVELVLVDGRRVVAHVGSGLVSQALRQTAVELPDGIDASAVRGVALRGVSAIVLDEHLRMRRLTARRAA